MKFKLRHPKDILRNISQGEVKYFKKRPELNRLKETDLAVYPTGDNAYMMVFRIGKELIEWKSDSAQKGMNTVYTVDEGDKLTIQNGLIIKIG